jgi:hypothetical protein
MNKESFPEKLACDFCYTKQEKFDELNCRECGFPLTGSEPVKAKFLADHEAEKQKIDEAETGLSQARFAMLWPSLTAILITFAFQFPPGNIPEFAVTIGYYGLFVVFYFIVSYRPVPILILSSLVLIAGILFSFANGMMFKIILIVPAMILFSFGNAIYLAKRAEKALEKMPVQIH